MPYQEIMMGFFDKAKCFFGNHDWGNWSFETSSSCRQIRMCRRSGCNEKETRTNHTWEKWDYEADDYCLKVRTCKRCKEKETGHIEHVWGSWRYAEDDSCLKVRTCQRCNKKEDGETQHIWGEWEYTTFEDARQRYTNKLRQLRHLLVNRFSKSELTTLCFELGIDYDDVPGEIKSEKATGLIKKVELYHRIPNLVESCTHFRPDIPWRNMGLLEAIKIEDFEVDKLSWEFDPSESCIQVRTCTRCGENNTRKKHAWNDELNYESPTSCVMAKYCRRCGEKEEEIVKHQWDQGVWAESGDDCCLVKTCQRCGKIEKTKKPHDWGPFDYESPVSCRLVRTCRHCQKNERGEEKHVWGNWNYESPVSCQLLSICQRCQEKRVDLELKHDWGEWHFRSSHSCKLYRECKRCHATEEQQELNHQWTEWSYESSDSCRLVRKCDRCEATQRGDIQHKWRGWAPDGLNGRPTRFCDHCGAMEADISGVWEGVAEFNGNNRHWWDLYLKQSDSSITGTLVSVYLHDNIPTVVKQSIAGQIIAQEVHFSGTSYSFLRQGNASSYNTDGVLCAILEDGTKIRGDVRDVGQGSAHVSLNFAKAESDSSLNVSGIWLGTSTDEDRTEGLILCLEQVDTVLRGVLFITYATGSLVFKKRTVVSQGVEGTIEDMKVMLKSTSYSLIQKGNVDNWLPDHIVGEIGSDSNVIEGVKFDEQQHRGKVVLKLGRTVSVN